MIFTSYEEQRSFPEYVDFSIKSLFVQDEYISGALPVIDWEELLNLIRDGYFPDFGECPEFIIDQQFTGKNRRKLKKFAKKLFKKYGEATKAKALWLEFDAEFERSESEYNLSLEVEA